MHNMSNIMAKSYLITMKVAEHGSCAEKKHTECNWDAILKETLEKQFPDMEISKPKIDANNILKVALKSKVEPIPKTELSWRLDDFFNHNRLVTMESYTLR